MDQIQADDTTISSFRLKEFHWGLAKLMEFGMTEKFIRDHNPNPDEVRELLKGIYYLEAWYNYNNKGLISNQQAS
jgi:hypothetical protein